MKRRDRVDTGYARVLRFPLERAGSSKAAPGATRGVVRALAPYRLSALRRNGPLVSQNHPPRVPRRVDVLTVLQPSRSCPARYGWVFTLEYAPRLSLACLSLASYWSSGDWRVEQTSAVGSPEEVTQIGRSACVRTAAVRWLTHSTKASSASMARVTLAEAAADSSDDPVCSGIPGSVQWDGSLGSADSAPRAIGDANRSSP
jgi:hypothetical protein